MMSRGTAVKLRIKDIADGNFERSSDRWEPNYLVTGWGEKISRVRVLATVVSKFVNEEKSYSTITLDDGSETITARAFREERKTLDDTNIGDIVDVVGKIKEYQDERYITPESVRKLDDPNWELVRRLELLLAMKTRSVAVGEAPLKEEVNREKDQQTTTKPMVLPEVEVEVVNGALESAPLVEPPSANTVEKKSGSDKKGSDHKRQILKIVKELDEGDGVKYITLLKESALTEDTLDSLLDALMQDGDVYEPKIGRFKGV